MIYPQSIALIRSHYHPEKRTLLVPRLRGLSSSALFLSVGVISLSTPDAPIYVGSKNRYYPKHLIAQNPVVEYLLDIIPELNETLTSGNLKFDPRPLAVLKMLAIPEPDREELQRLVRG